METRKQRQSNMELLRIIAMLMVVSLHYLGKGGLLPSLPARLGMDGLAVWLLEAFCIGAVNVYVLISGYFLVESFRWKKAISLWLQVAFYSMLVPVVLLAAGILKPSDLTIYHLLMYVFPVMMEHYWFATSYIFLYLFSPLINKGIRCLNRQQHLSLMIGLLAVFSLLKSVLPVALSLDKAGYDVIWFLCLYVTAAYIRLYGFSFFDNWKKGLLVYLGSTLGILGWLAVMNEIGLTSGRFTERITMSYEYNHILVYLAAVGLFYTFLYVPNIGGLAGKWIITIAEGTFGVYLLHEHIEVRALWPQWLGVTSQTEFEPLRYLGCILLVFAVGILTDYIRRQIFRLIGRVTGCGRIADYLDRCWRKEEP